MKILIVEDDAEISNILVMFFRQQGHEADLVDDGAVARQRLDDEGPSFDLVISDARLPGMTGAALLEHCRARGLDVPFLLCSGDPDEEVRSDGAAFLVKPFDFAALQAAVADLVGSR